MKIYRCKLSKPTQRRLAALFCAGASARAAAPLCGVARATATLFFRKIRAALAAESKPPLSGVVEVDETYLAGGKGGRRAARQGRNLAGKIAVVGIVERGTRRAHLERVNATNAAKLESFCIRNAAPEALINSDSFRAYNGLKKRGFSHLRVNHFLTFKNRITGACTNLIESLWAFMKRHFARFCGGWRHNLRLWLAEIEARFYYGAADFFRKIKRLEA